jgi:hypothetical protein
LIFGGVLYEKSQVHRTACYERVILAIGILGIANVGFFNSNTGLEIIEIIMGIGGLIVALRNS